MMLNQAAQLSAVESDFSYTIIDNTPYIHDSYALRYQVYCLERNFLKCEDYPARLERDAFDSNSIHVGAIHHNGQLSGTARLVLTSRLGFPLLKKTSFFSQYQELGDPENPRLCHTAEISRLAVSKCYSRQANGRPYGMLDIKQDTPANGQPYCNNAPEVITGLYKVMYQASKRLGITTWLAAMEKSLWILLRRSHFIFTPIGPLVDYYGPVIPYMAKLADIEEHVYHKNPALFWEFMNGLEPEFLPKIAKT